MARREKAAKTTGPDGGSITGCVIYVRVSTQRQAAEGVSLDAQLAACERLAAARGWRVLSVHRDEGISGRKGHDERPGLAEVLAAVHGSPSTAVLVYSLSRLGRSQRMVAELLDETGPYGLRVVSASEPIDMTTAMGKAIAGVITVFAQLESDLASERTTAALAFAKSKGQRLGAPSMVETVAEDGSRVLDADKCAVIQRVQAVARETGLALRPLCAELARRGITTANGKRWHPRTLTRALAFRIAISAPVETDSSPVASVAPVLAPVAIPPVEPAF